MGRSCLKRFLRNIAGAAAVELALVTPLLMALMFGLTDISLAVSQRLKLIDAAQNGIQYGQLRNPVEGDVSKIVAAIGPGETGNSRASAVTLYCECGEATRVSCAVTCAGSELPRRYLDVIVRETYTTIFPYPVAGSTIPLEAHAVVRLQ